MIEVLLLRLDAPLMSFGGVAVDATRPTEDLPTLSMLTGLLGNALGYDHADSEALQSLQARLDYAVRGPVIVEKVVDYQTVDLGQDFMLADKVGWTTRGAVDVRKGGLAARKGTHQRYRHFVVDAAYSVALTVQGHEVPSVHDLIDALRRPARPLFIGRKSCLPSQPLLALGEPVQVERLVDAFAHLPAVPREVTVRRDGRSEVRIWSRTDQPARHRAVPLTDERDWANQTHVGRRWMAMDIVQVGEVTS